MVATLQSRRAPSWGEQVRLWRKGDIWSLGCRHKGASRGIYGSITLECQRLRDGFWAQSH